MLPILHWKHFPVFLLALSLLSLAAEVLLAEMKTHPDRFLRPYSRDFFYVTAVQKGMAGDREY